MAFDKIKKLFGKEQKQPKKSSLVLGASGNEPHHGYFDDIIQDSHESLLNYNNKMVMFYTMYRRDATIMYVIQFYRQMITGASWDFKEDKDIPDEIIEACREQFFKKIDWNKFLSDSLFMLVFGAMFFEKIYDNDPNRKYQGFKAFAPRMPFSLDDNSFAHPSTNEKGLWQQSVVKDNNYDDAFVPMWKLFEVQNAMEGDDRRGFSPLEAVFKNFQSKLIGERGQGQHAVKMIGALYGSVPAGSGDKTTESVKNAIKYNEFGENSGFVIEGDPDQLKLDFLTPKTQYDYMPLLNYHSLEILSAFSLEWVRNGTMNKGGNNQSTQQKDTTISRARSWATYWKKKVEREVLKEFVDMNWTVKKYPELVYKGIGERDLANIATDINKLSGSKHITPTIETENHFRKQYNIPEITEEEREANKPKEQSPQQFPPKKEPEKKPIREPKESNPEETEEVKKKIVKNVIVKDEVSNTQAHMKVVNDKKLSSILDKAEEDFRKIFSIYSPQIIDKFVGQVEDFLLKNEGDFTYNTKEFEKALADKMREISEAGKAQASKEIGELRPPLSDEERKANERQAEMIATSHVDEMKTQTQATSNNSIIAGAVITALMIKNAKTNSKEAMESAANKQINGGVGLQSSQLLNQGRNLTFNAHADKIEMFQYSAILDSKTTNICKDLDGRTGTAEDVQSGALPRPPVHANCRSILVAIRKDQPNKPAINLPPESVVSRINVNPFNTKTN